MEKSFKVCRVRRAQLENLLGRTIEEFLHLVESFPGREKFAKPRAVAEVLILLDRDADEVQRKIKNSAQLVERFEQEKKK